MANIMALKMILFGFLFRNVDFLERGFNFWPDFSDIFLIWLSKFNLLSIVINSYNTHFQKQMFFFIFPASANTQNVFLEFKTNKFL